MRAHQPSIVKAFVQAAGTGVREPMVDRRIVDPFVHNIQPLHIVESPHLGQPDQDAEPQQEVSV